MSRQQTARSHSRSDQHPNWFPHWTFIGSQEAHRLFQLLSKLAELVDESHITHINQTTLITAASSNEI